MKLAIMQPYFLPYIGYWQLMKYVDTMVIYDDIQFSKGGWVNRNRIRDNKYITLPLRNDSDYLNINQRYLSNNWINERERYIRKISNYYINAKNYSVGINIAKEVINKNFLNLFSIIYHSINIIREYLDITTPIVISSKLKLENELAGSKRVKAICKLLEADNYINPIGGLTIYSKDDFINNGINLEFLKTRISYYQRINNFTPSLSILDIIMFTTQNETKNMLKEFDIL